MRGINVLGKRFARLAVLQRVGRRNGQTYWLCQCDCGRQHETTGPALASGRVKSCGCLNNEMRVARNTKHGHAQRGAVDPVYKLWINMRARCSKPTHPDYALYGARGIRVCARWQVSFAAFLEDMGQRPSGRNGRLPAFSVDRINPDGNYEPGNCRWATWHEQRMNQRRMRRRVA